ncbi:hypothetical protein [Nocardioides caldifontis]|uniref:hypothetical protein n=1 Tax=Nocardioides caldifontis TaxID=2588938 RepID=UPI0011DF5878|nr:hypothetical protein [Nocardioides caldifontis]
MLTSARSSVRSSKALLAVLLAMAALWWGAALPADAEVTVRDTASRSWTVNGRVLATKIVGNVVYVGGTFTTATSPTGQNVTRRGLAAFRLSDGALVTGFAANVNNGGSVRTIVSDGSSLWVGGAFSSIGGVSRGRVAKLNLSTGGVDTSFQANTNGMVRALEVRGNDLYIGGQFSTVRGTTRSNLAEVRAATGVVDTAFNRGANGWVSGLRLSPDGNRLWATGNFTTLGGGSRVGLGGVSTTNGAVAGPNFPASVRPQFGLDINTDGSRIFVVGQSNVLGAYRTDTGGRPWLRRAEGDTQAVRFFNNEVYFGFHEGYEGNTRLKVLAADPTNGAIDPSFRPNVVGFWGVFAIDATAAGLVIGGEFTSAGGVTARGWARFLR